MSSWGRSESGRHDQPGGRRRLPARRGDAAVLGRAGRRPPPGGARAPTTAAPSRRAVAWFPMQADLYARVRVHRRVFALHRGGRARRGAAASTIQRSARPSARLRTVVDRFISREHYLMWRPSATGPYARVGRFYAPYGLRFVEHIYFVRRYTGYELYNETYNVVGRLRRRRLGAARLRVHAAAVELPGPAAVRRAARIGRRRATSSSASNGMAALAAQARVGIGSEASRYQGGLVGKLWIEPGQDAVPRRGGLHPPEGDRRDATARTSSCLPRRDSCLPMRGVMIGAAYERFQENLSVSRHRRATPTTSADQRLPVGALRGRAALAATRWSGTRPARARR